MRKPATEIQSMRSAFGETPPTADPISALAVHVYRFDLSVRTVERENILGRALARWLFPSKESVWRDKGDKTLQTVEENTQKPRD